MKKKNIVYMSLFFVLSALISISVVNADTVTYENVCNTFDSGIGSAIRILGHLLLIIKIIVPVVIIVLGMIDFGKAVLSSDDKAMTKAVGALTRRIIAGVVIFLAPGLVSAILNIFGITGGIEDETRFGACTQCILNASDHCPM